MIKQCKSCRAKTDAADGPCPVCGIGQDTPKAELSDVQKHVRRAARHIRQVAMLHLLLTGILILMLPELAKPVAIVVLALINCLIAIGLIRFAFWGYRLAVTVYFLVGIVFTIKVFIPGILFALLLLYFVGNGTAKAIFERRAGELV
jgi:hypothetical protein